MSSLLNLQVRRARIKFDLTAKIHCYNASDVFTLAGRTSNLLQFIRTELTGVDSTQNLIKIYTDTDDTLIEPHFPQARRWHL